MGDCERGTFSFSREPRVNDKRRQKQGDVVMFRAFFVFMQATTDALFRKLSRMHFVTGSRKSGIRLLIIPEPVTSPWHFDPADPKCVRALGRRLRYVIPSESVSLAVTN